jgi:hypothetical protein
LKRDGAISFTASLLIARYGIPVVDSVARRAPKCKPEAQRPRGGVWTLTAELRFKGRAELRLNEIETPFDSVKGIVHSIEAQAHLRHFPRHIRNAAFDRTEATALFALLLADFAKLVADRTKMFENELGDSSAIARTMGRRGRAAQDEGVMTVRRPR